MARHPVTAEDVVEIEALGQQIVADMLSPLPPEQREAVAAHVLDEAPYEELARDAGVSTSAIRHRVSRGLHALRDQLAGDRR